jgi:hypothetical protein
MREDLDPVVGSEAPGTKVENEFHEEINLAFSLELDASEDKGALSCLERMIFGAVDEHADVPDRLFRLLDKFEGCTFDPVQRYQN